MNIPNLSAAAVRHPSLTLFIIVLTAIAGLIAFLQLGRAEDPAFTVKAMVVTAAWPGATAEEMQSSVADPLEKRLQELDRAEDHLERQRAIEVAEAAPKSMNRRLLWLIPEIKRPA